MDTARHVAGRRVGVNVEFAIIAGLTGDKIGGSIGCKLTGAADREARVRSSSCVTLQLGCRSYVVQSQYEDVITAYCRLKILGIATDV